jgi:hypothetical protein
MRLVRLAGRVVTSLSFDSPSGHSESCQVNSGEHRESVVSDDLSANPPDTPGPSSSWMFWGRNRHREFLRYGSRTVRIGYGSALVRFAAAMAALPS